MRRLLDEQFAKECELRLVELRERAADLRSFFRPHRDPALTERVYPAFERVLVHERLQRLGYRGLLERVDQVAGAHHGHARRAAHHRLLLEAGFDETDPGLPVDAIEHRLVLVRHQGRGERLEIRGRIDGAPRRFVDAADRGKLRELLEMSFGVLTGSRRRRGRPEQTFEPVSRHL